MRSSAPFMLRISFVLVILIGVVISMKSIREPDLWWQLRTGEWILENQQVPQTDVFSFSYPDAEWVNVKWGFEVLQALISTTGGPEMIPLLQVFLTIALLLIILQIIKVFGRSLKDPDYRPGFGGVLALLAALLILENRMTGRPEAISHLMTASFVLLFIRYRQKPSPWIFLIVPLQVLWTNLHEAYGMGIIVASMFTAAAWFEYLFLRKAAWFASPLKNHKPWLMTGATLLAFFAIGLNPIGIAMWWHPVEIFSQLGENKYTIELYSFRMQEYWNLRSILSLLLVLMTFLFLKRPRLLPKTAKAPVSIWWKGILNKIGLGYLLFLISIFYLMLSANRNIPFMVVAMMPLLGLSWDEWVDRLSVKRPRLQAGPWILSIGIILYIMVVSGIYYKTFNPRDRYGLEINVEKNPNGAARFIKENNIQGRAFTDFLSSSYLLWYLQPDFKTYIDLRDLDIFPPIFFENNFMLYQFPERVFPFADADMQFDYVVLLNNPQFQPVHQYLLNSEAFDLVYGDLLASVYLRKNEENQSLIEKLGFRTTGQDIFHSFKALNPSVQARWITKIFNPFHASPTYPVVDPRARAAFYQYMRYSPQIQ